MVTRSFGRVFRRGDQWRVDVPAALTCLSGLTLLVGIEPHVRRRAPWLAWGSLLVAGAAGAAWWVARSALGWEVAVDKWGVRLESSGGEKIDLGVPTSVRQGRDARTHVPRFWVAVETDTGRVFMFESVSGMFSSGFTEWPEAAAPEDAETFSSATFDLAAFRAALWTAMLR